MQTVKISSEQLIVGNRQEWKQAILKAIEQDPHIEVDLSKVAYIDSSGLGMLVSVQRSAEDEGGSLSVNGLSDDIQNLLELADLTCLLPGGRSKSTSRGPRLHKEDEGPTASVSPMFVAGQLHETLSRANQPVYPALLLARAVDLLQAATKDIAEWRDMQGDSEPGQIEQDIDAFLRGEVRPS